MVSTYLSYQLISRDVGKAIQRVESQPMVKRDTEYFLENIAKVKSADEFVKDTRLFNYAMKAFSLEDMAYAKAFMLKALKEGVSDPDAFANKLTDKRYAEFVRAFNFEAYGEKATTYNTARDNTALNFTNRVTMGGMIPETAAAKADTAYFHANIGKVKSAEDLLADTRLGGYVLYAFQLENEGLTREQLLQALNSDLTDADSPARKHPNENVAKMVAAFNFDKFGEDTTTHVAAQHETVKKYSRQTLESDAGQQNEGVRLALYFQRKAPEIKSFYNILGDKALSQVVRTALGLPDSMAQADVDQQVKTFAKKMKIEDLQDPKKLEKFVNRFTTMWEIANPSTSVTSLATTLFSPPQQYGISADTMLAIATLKR